VKIFYNFFFNKIINLRLCHIYYTDITAIEFLHFEFIFTFGIRLIEYVIFFIFKPHASETIPTADTVAKKTGIRTIFAIHREKKCVALEAIHTLITKLRGICIKTVKTVFGLPYNVTVTAVLITDTSEYEIAVSALE